METYPLWECPNKEAALRELLEMNTTTFWNQIVVEDQDQMTDSQDLKEQAAIGATDSKTGHDDGKHLLSFTLLYPRISLVSSYIFESQKRLVW